MGSIGSSTRRSLAWAWNATVCRSVSTSHIQDRSGNGSCSVAVWSVLVSPPKRGIAQDAPKLRAGLRSTKCSASVSPGSAPATWNGPVCGLTNGMVSVMLGRSVTCRILPQNASSVHSRSTVPGWIFRMGATPPNVNAYWSRSGRNSITSIEDLSLVPSVFRTLVLSIFRTLVPSVFRVPASQRPGRPVQDPVYPMVLADGQCLSSVRWPPQAQLRAGITVAESVPSGGRHHGRPGGVPRFLVMCTRSGARSRPGAGR